MRELNFFYFNYILQKSWYWINRIIFPVCRSTGHYRVHLKTFNNSLAEAAGYQPVIKRYAKAVMVSQPRRQISLYFSLNSSKI
jgi:hypothetical protein